MRIAVDIKNLALYTGGIAQYFAPLLAYWIESWPDDSFLLVGPRFDITALPASGNWQHVEIAWPEWLPRPLRHPYYDIVLFPRAMRRLQVDFLFSPYHDVRLVAGVRSAIMIHDVCLQDMAAAYPRRIRAYFLAMLRHNLRIARDVLTVSQASRERIVARYGIDPARVSVVYNTTHPTFQVAALDPVMLETLRAGLPAARRILFYPGSSEYRKNLGGLLCAFETLAQDAALDVILVATGEKDGRWAEHLDRLPYSVAERVVFVGRVDHVILKHYYWLADAVVFPSFCEGFGRVCLECMMTGTPLACSELPVLREVAGPFPFYFDPYQPDTIAAQVRKALAAQRRPPVEDERFAGPSVKARFLEVMDQVCRGRFREPNA